MEEKTRQDIERELNKWAKVILVIGGLILITSGFAFGYLYGDKSCFEDPFGYGINKLNKVNDDKFICDCYSGKYNQPISFDEDGITTETYSHYLPEADSDLPLIVQE